jgi:serine/threonine protein kinase/uncharacterized protein YdcH (DUF465 family)
MAVKSNGNLLTINQTFQTVAGEFKILRRLGQGATSEVYQAQSRDGKRTVAIKVMRPTNLEFARKLFIGEGLTLAQMRSVEKKAKDGIFVTPEYFGADPEASTPYIIEEIMTGKSFPELVSADHLSEEDAIVIGVQLFRTLHLLSSELKQNYIDLKFENLWWDGRMKILKITDWGTLEDANPDGQARDILRASRYIYYLVTGHPITESRGILNQAVDAFPEWSQLSWGLQEILRRLLHPFPSARVGDDLLSLDSAEKIAQEFRNLDEYWKESADQLLADIRLSVDAAQKADPERDIEQQTLHYRLARTALEIALKRRISAKELDDRLRSTIMTESDYFTRARNLYEGTSYAPARKLFQIGARLLSSSRLRRWAWLANAGESAREKNYSRVKDLAEHVVELMEQERYEDARTRLSDALEQLNSEALRTLHQECEVLILTKQAVSAEEYGDFRSAEKAYRSAYEIWIKITDHEVWRDKVGDLLMRADIVRNLGEKEEEVNRILNDLKVAQKLEIVLNGLQKALRLAPGNSKVYALATTLATDRFDAGLLEDASRILWVCGIAPATPLNAIDWRCPDEIRLAFDARNTNVILLHVARIRNDKEALPHKLAIALLEKQFTPSKDVLGIDRNNAIADAMMCLDSELGKKMKGQVQNWKIEALNTTKKKVDFHLAEAEGLLFADRPGALHGKSISQAFAYLQDRLRGVETALELLDEASRLVGDEDDLVRSKIEELKQRGVAMKDELSRSISENKEQREETIAALKAKAVEILGQLDQLDVASSKMAKAGLPSRISDSLNGFQAERLGEVKELCNQVLDMDAENRWAIQTRQRVDGLIQGLGDYATLAVVSQKNVIDAAVEALLNEARDYYQYGRILEAAKSLRKIETLDPQADERKSFSELKTKTTMLMGMKYWEKENKAKLEDQEFEPQLLEKIAPYFSADIPIEFRKDSVSLRYLIAAKSKLFAQLMKINPVSFTSEFADTLRNLVWTDNLYRRGLDWQKGLPARQKSEKWDATKFTQNILNARNKRNFGQKMEKILAGVPIFQNPQARSGELTSVIVEHNANRIFKSKTPDLQEPKVAPKAEWKWVVGVESIILILCISVIALLFFAPGLRTEILSSFVPTPTVVITEVVPETPTEAVVETPDQTTEAPTEPVTEVLTAMPVPLIPNYCIKQNGKIRSQPQVVDTPTSNVVFTASDQSSCLYFDISSTVNGMTWYRIAVGQKIGDLDVGGYWVGNPVQWLTNWIPPTVTPTSSQ